MCDAMPLLVELPEEILVDEILARLPVKSLSRFKCVSKSWRSLIESDQLFRVHYQNSAKNPRVITMSLKAQGINAGCSLHSLLESEERSDSNPTKNEPKEGVLVGCCNGVVCFYNFRGYRKFTLWNPATSVSVELLPHNGGAPVLGKSGFGWDESTGAYKVFAHLYDYNHHLKRGSIYSSDTNSWRTISPVPDSSTSDARGVFLRGNLHWVDRRHSHIELLNLESEEFGRIDMPLISSNDRIDLGVIGGNLSILIDLEKGFEVWMMKEYGVKDSWLKTLTFHSTLSWPTRCVTRPLFGEDPNGEIFVIYGETLIIYSPKDDASSTATNKVCFFEALVYVESLVSPKTILGV